MKRVSAPPEVPRRSSSWIQTGRREHEAWAHFSLRKPAAGALLHLLVSRVGAQNAVVITQAVLAQLLGVSDRTIRTALGDLATAQFIQIVRLGKGREAAYVVNDRVAWGQPREHLRLSTFSATVVASAADQDPADLAENAPLHRLPRMFPGEQQLPTGDGLPPPSEPSLPGLEPDLPALVEPDREPMEEPQSLGSITGRLVERLG